MPPHALCGDGATARMTWRTDRAIANYKIALGLKPDDQMMWENVVRAQMHMQHTHSRTCTNELMHTHTYTHSATAHARERSRECTHPRI